MTFSCTDFTDCVLETAERLGWITPDSYDNQDPEDQSRVVTTAMHDVHKQAASALPLRAALTGLLDWCAGGDIPQDLYDAGRAALSASHADTARTERGQLPTARPTVPNAEAILRMIVARLDSPESLAGAPVDLTSELIEARAALVPPAQLLTYEGRVALRDAIAGDVEDGYDLDLHEMLMTGVQGLLTWTDEELVNEAAEREITVLPGWLLRPDAEDSHGSLDVVQVPDGTDLREAFASLKASGTGSIGGAPRLLDHPEALAMLRAGRRAELARPLPFLAVAAADGSPALAIEFASPDSLNAEGRPVLPLQNQGETCTTDGAVGGAPTQPVAPQPSCDSNPPTIADVPDDAWPLPRFIIPR